MTRWARRALTSLAAGVTLLASASAAALGAQDAGATRLDGGRFSVYAYPQDAALARAVLEAARTRDTFPGLPRPTRRVVIAIAPDARRFREWVGPSAPEWGSAIAFPDEQRTVLHGRSASSDAGDPIRVLRHELAHLALHEALPDAEIPRWFDEGYASLVAGEWGRDELIALQLALAARRGGSLAALDSAFTGGAVRAEAAYALATRAVIDLAALDPARGLALLFDYWRSDRRLDVAVRHAYGITLSGFEVQWAERTRRRYGALAIASDLGLAGIVLLLVLGPLWWARRRRDRRRLAAMAAADAAAEARARAQALEALLALGAPPPADGAPPVPPPSEGTR
ncbi:MAG: hypothetical protein SFW08_10905 [Gemmatimonadaceae bacterium]|nr:hypothetical protein [Gemmatimonadaceae bacterium]